MAWVNPRRIFHLENAPNRSNHCQVPTPLVFDNFVRVYYSARRHGQAFITFFDLAHDLKTILYHHEKPLMELGKPGHFDSDGMMPSCIVQHGDELWLYFIGWNARAKGARYQNEIGLAMSKDGGETFARMFEGPIIGRSPTEPGLAVMPFVMLDDGVFRAWYQSGTSWEFINGQYEPVYVLKHAASLDGIRWKRDPETCVYRSHPLEAFSRPSVIKKCGIYSMYYCQRDSRDYRGGKGSYRIGYATSTDGKEFIRGEDPMIKRSDWDSNTQCYPYIFEFNGKMLMLYNGNEFGQTGVGIAEWQ